MVLLLNCVAFLHSTGDPVVGTAEPQVSWESASFPVTFYGTLSLSQIVQVHDIEDLVKFGHEAKACPFFMSRDLHATAELVFCPYNYIIDPAIRSAMQIDLTGSVVIFDEAHVRSPLLQRCALYQIVYNKQ